MFFLFRHRLTRNLNRFCSLWGCHWIEQFGGFFRLWLSWLRLRWRQVRCLHVYFDNFATTCREVQLIFFAAYIVLVFRNWGFRVVFIFIIALFVQVCGNWWLHAWSSFDFVNFIFCFFKLFLLLSSEFCDFCELYLCLIYLTFLASLLFGFFEHFLWIFYLVR